MLKKTFASLAVAGLLVLGGASAASAATYPPGGADSAVIVSDPTVVPGQPTTITITGLDGLTFVDFSTTGGTLASVVAAGATSTVTKPVSSLVNGSASAQFTSNTPGNHVITVSSNGTVIRTVTVTVAGAAAGGLPATGGTVPAAALWIGVGAVGIGGIAVAAGVARRRAASSN